MKTIGIDYGTKRVGVAVSDPGGIIAMPFRVLDVSNNADAVKQVCDLCTEISAELIVVGVPLNMDGTSGEMAEKVNKFVKILSKKTEIPVKTEDERLSTSMVERVLLDADMSRKKRKGVRDKLAAQVILQSYLDKESSVDLFDFDYDPEAME